MGDYKNNKMKISATRYNLSDTTEQHFVKVAIVSDIHNNFSDTILSQLGEANPDFIFVTGDVIKSKLFLKKQTFNFLESLSRIANSFVVLGNHECASDYLQDFIHCVEGSGCRLLDNSSASMFIYDRHFNIIGLSDIGQYYRNSNSRNPIRHFSRHMIDKFSEYQRDLIVSLKKESCYNILLSHRPDLFSNVYSNIGLDLVLSGHTHGGMICLPNGKPFFAVGQGLFPKYAEGIHKCDKTSIIISRGLGNSISKLRINSDFEIVIATI